MPNEVDLCERSRAGRRRPADSVTRQRPVGPNTGLSGDAGLVGEGSKLSSSVCNPDEHVGTHRAGGSG